MWVYKDPLLAFVANGRTASHSTGFALRRNVGFQKVVCHFHGSYFKEGWRYFTFVRNHWDAMASYMFFTGWNFPARGLPKPEDLDHIVRCLPFYFKKDDRTREDIPALWKWVGTRYDPVVLRFEDYHQNLDDFLRVEGLPPLGEVQHINYTQHKRNGLHYSKVFTPETRQWVFDKWGQEIEELGYEYEEPSWE